MSRVRTVAWVLATLAVASAASVVAATGGAAAGGPAGFGAVDGPAPLAAESGEVVQTVTYERVRAVPGEIRATQRYRLGTNVSTVVVYNYTRSRVVAASGFVERPSGRWTWDERTDEPSLTLRMRVNRTGHRFHGREYVDTGAWALADPPRAFAYRRAAGDGWRYSWNEEAVDRRTAVAGEGHAGESVVFLGAHETLRRSVGGETLRVVRPEQANVSARAALNALEGAARRLHVGERTGTVTVFVGPEPLRPGGAASAASGGTRDVWVSETAAVGAPTNTWIHEYVHTRQNLTLAPEMAWFREASASYYAGLLSVDQGLGPQGADARFAARLRGDGPARAVLADPSTWRTQMAPYRRGQRVLAALDARIRAQTDGNRTLQAVFRRLNARETVTVESFAGTLANVTGRSQASWVDAHVLDDALVSAPNVSALSVETDATLSAANTTAGRPVPWTTAGQFPGPGGSHDSAWPVEPRTLVGPPFTAEGLWADQW